MEIAAGKRNSYTFFATSSTVVLVIWLASTILMYWNAPNQTISSYDCRWLLSSLAVATFFTCILINAPSSVMCVAVHVSAQYCFVYCTVSTIFNCINGFYVLSNLSNNDRGEATEYLQLTCILIFLSIIGIFLTIFLLYNLIKMMMEMDSQSEPLCRKSHIKFCSAMHLILAFVNFKIWFSTNVKAPYAASFSMQQICCTGLSLSIAFLQWIFRNSCNIHLLRSIVILNACQFIQELTFAYNTYEFILVINSDVTAATATAANLAKIQRLLICAFAVHGIRLLLCSYTVILCAKKAFPSEITSSIRFLPDRERGIGTNEAFRAERADDRESKLIFRCALVLSILCGATDFAYVQYGTTRRVGNTGISFIYTICSLLAYYQYRKERRALYLKLAAIFSISIFVASFHTVYVFIDALIKGRLSQSAITSIFDGVITGTYLLLTLGLVALSIASANFCFKTITKHTALCTQPTFITGLLRWLTKIAYFFTALIAIEVFFAIIMQTFFASQIDILLQSEVYLWIGSLSSCFLQIWICKHERFQRCLLILIIQLIVDCSTTLPLVMMQAGILQTIIKIMTRHGKTFQGPVIRIIFFTIDHILQILQWILSICSLGLTLVVLDAIETNSEESPEVVENPTFTGRLFNISSIHELLIAEEGAVVDVNRAGDANTVVDVNNSNAMNLGGNDINPSPRLLNINMDKSIDGNNLGDHQLLTDNVRVTVNDRENENIANGNDDVDVEKGNGENIDDIGKCGNVVANDRDVDDDSGDSKFPGIMNHSYSGAEIVVEDMAKCDSRTFSQENTVSCFASSNYECSDERNLVNNTDNDSDINKKNVNYDGDGGNDSSDTSNDVDDDNDQDDSGSIRKDSSTDDARHDIFRNADDSDIIRRRIRENSKCSDVSTDDTDLDNDDAEVTADNEVANCSNSQHKHVTNDNFNSKAS